MNKAEAQAALFNGRHIRHKSWNELDYIYYDKPTGRLLMGAAEVVTTCNPFTKAAPDTGWEERQIVTRVGINSVYSALDSGLRVQVSREGHGWVDVEMRNDILYYAGSHCIGISRERLTEKCWRICN